MAPIGGSATMVVSACQSSPTMLLVAGLARNYDNLGIGLHAHVVGMEEDLAEPARESLVALGIKRFGRGKR